MKVLIAPLVGGVGLGPLTRCLAVAFEVRRRNHEVLFLARPEFAEIAASFGYNTVIAPAPNTHIFNHKEYKAFKVSDDAVNLGWCNVESMKEAIARERQVIQSFRPDYVFTEYQMSTVISCALEGVPLVSTATWPDHPQFKSPLFTIQDELAYEGDLRLVNELLLNYGLAPIADICELTFLRAQIKVAPTLPALQPELKALGDVDFVGYLHSSEFEEAVPSNAFPIDPSKNLIYVYLSPGEIDHKVWIPTIIEAFRDTEFQVFATLSPLRLDYPKGLPQNIQFFRKLPSMNIMKKSALVITHGGANTVHGALLAGVPQIIHSGRYAERDYNGRGVERIGAGLNRRIEQLNPVELLKDARTLVSVRSFREIASQTGKELLLLGGAARVVEILEAQLNLAGDVRGLSNAA